MKPNALICTKTGEEYPLNEPIWQSPEGHLLDIRFRPTLEKTLIRNRSANLWRYREAIPIEKDENIVSFGEGATPMQKINIAGVDVYFKLDFLFPTGSYKDRGSSVLISKIKELGIRHVVQDSSGNAGSSIAAYCAKADIACDIYVPKGVAEAKLAQMRAFGANVKVINGTRQDAAEAAWEAAQRSYYASHCWNPFFFQGTKTFAFEVAEQLGWKAPDVVILPAGNGTLLIGAYIGFRELMKAGVTDKIPKLIGVQAANCSPLYEAYQEGLPYIPAITALPSIAEGIAIAKPIRGNQMLQYVELTEGIFLAVSEEEITDALLLMCSKGYFIEPTSAAVVAGVRQYVEHFWEGEKIVSVLTGSGLKAIDKIITVLKSS
ncbi:MAG: threonine synthase [Raineya sp.]|nr:threonine synthase [Raineya sp.]